MKLNDSGREQPTVAVFTAKDFFSEHRETVRKIENAYDEDRYVDIDGLVWLGTVDERWVMEEDAHYWLTKEQMLKKMINELSGDEQFSRDEAVRREAQYEYSVQYTLKGKRMHVPQWMTKQAAEEWLKHGGTSGENEFGSWTKALVRRRKAGPVEVVDS